MSAKMGYEILPRSSKMQRTLAIFPISIALLLFISSDLMAQTATPASPTLSKRALRHQDREACNKLAVQLTVKRSNLANFIRECMAEAQASRKAAAKTKPN
jgi:hypothetical protein